MDNENYDELFREYLKVCNLALKSAEGRFPYVQMLKVLEQFLCEGKLHIAVIDDTPKAEYHLQLKNHQLQMVDAEAEEDHDGWHVKANYMKHVVNHPDEYINHPAKLDWDWLKSRLKD